MQIQGTEVEKQATDRERENNKVEKEEIPRDSQKGKSKGEISRKSRHSHKIRIDLTMIIHLQTGQ